jgi:hypothetical protein
MLCSGLMVLFLIAAAPAPSGVVDAEPPRFEAAGTNDATASIVEESVAQRLASSLGRASDSLVARGAFRAKFASLHERRVSSSFPADLLAAGSSPLHCVRLQI